MASGGSGRRGLTKAEAIAKIKRDRRSASATTSREHPGDVTEQVAPASPAAASVGRSPAAASVGRSNSDRQPTRRYILPSEPDFKNDFTGEPASPVEESGASFDIASPVKTELYLSDQTFEPMAPWWKSNFSINGPILFGTWDGVFTSCMVNIFGVVIFLRMGWMVGNAGLKLSLLVIFVTECVALITVLCAIGICTRIQIVCPGGVYTLLSHVIGSRIATPIALVYCFGQAVTCSLCVTAFGESILDLLGMDDIWVIRGIASGVLLLLLGIVVAGVSWVVGFQLIFILFLFIAVLDFTVGSFIRTDPAHGVVGYTSGTFWNNTGPQYQDGESFFSVLGVFFPMACGVLAGINMSSDLKDPGENIPKGTLSALGVSSAIYVVFAFIMSATCLRTNLQVDYMIADKMSATRVLWLIGLYELSLSSAVGNLTGPPQILQAIATEEVFKFMKPLAHGHGPNNLPLMATLVFIFISFLFIFVGQLNSLSQILTVPFMITYAAVNFSFFILTMSIDQRASAEVTIPPPPSKDQLRTQEAKAIIRSSWTSSFSSVTNYGATARSNEYSDSDVDLLFTRDEKRTLKKDEDADESDKGSAASRCIAHVKELITRCSSMLTFNNLTSDGSLLYVVFGNRWMALIGASVCVVSVFLIEWRYAVAHVVFIIGIWMFIGFNNPGVFPGIADFSFRKWFQDTFQSCRQRYGHPAPPKQMIIPRDSPPMQTRTSRLSEENRDFASRDQFHQFRMIGPSRSESYDKEYEGMSSHLDPPRLGVSSHLDPPRRGVSSHLDPPCAPPLTLDSDNQFQHIRVVSARRKGEHAESSSDSS